MGYLAGGFLDGKHPLQALSDTIQFWISAGSVSGECRVSEWAFAALLVFAGRAELS